MTGLELIAVALVTAVIILLMAGYPAALTLGGVALIAALTGGAFGAFPLPLLNALPSRIFGVVTSESLTAIPMRQLITHECNHHARALTLLADGD